MWHPQLLSNSRVPRGQVLPRVPLQLYRSRFHHRGFADPFYNKSKEISYGVTSHVSLSTAVGDAAVAECTSNSPSNDPASFVALASVTEVVSFSTYCASVLLRPSLTRLISPNTGSSPSIESRPSLTSVPFSRNRHFPGHWSSLRRRDSRAGRLYYRGTRGRRRTELCCMIKRTEKSTTRGLAWDLPPLELQVMAEYNVGGYEKMRQRDMATEMQ
jgi:hypothetical protein